MPNIIIDNAETDPIELPVAIKKRTVTLNDEQIKALPSTPVQIVPTPGEGKLIAALSAVIAYNTEAGAYSNVDETAYINLTYGTVSEVLNNISANSLSIAGRTGGFASILQATDGFGIYGNGGNPISQLENQGLNLFIYNNGQGDLSGGHANNTFTITVAYMIVDL